MTFRNQLAGSARAFVDAFSNRDLRRLQLAGAGSTLGVWAYSIAIAVYAYDAGGAKTVGVVLFVRWSLGAAFAPWLALFADRGSRRRVMLAVDLSRAALLGGMAAAAAMHGPPLGVYVLAVAASIVSTGFAPAQAALLPSLATTPEELTASNLALNTISSVGMFAGPALGGAVLAFSGPWLVFALTSAAYLWSAACVLGVAADAPPERADEPGAVLPQLLGGFRAIAADSRLRVIVGLTGAQALIAGALEVLLVIIAIRLLHAGNAGVGWLNTGLGVGGLLGAFVGVGLAGRKRLADDFRLGLALFGLALALAAAGTNLAFVLVVFGAIGVGNTIFDVAGMTLLQRAAPSAVLGRVFGVLESLILATLALGSLVAPGLVALIGVRATIVAAGLLLPALLVPTWGLLTRIDAAAPVAAEPLQLLRSISIFASLPAPVVERLAASATAMRVPATAAVFSQGERGDSFYVIASGRAAVEVGGVEVAQLEAGEFFGEIALLRDIPRTATVSALVDLRLFALERDTFIAAVTGHAPSREAADRVVLARLPAGMAL
ncbi:MAG: MFS transporter [Gaiellaceae bacterium]